MRIPNYLRLAPSGIWHFRQRIPQPLTQKFGAREFARSLGTRDLLTAQVRALTLAQAYARAITEPRGLDVMATEGKGMVALQVVEVLPVARAGKKYRVVRNADGSVEIEANGKADHALAKDMVESIGPFSREAYVIEQASRPAASLDSKIPALPIGKVVTQWLADIKSGTKAKTFSIKTTAVENFARHYGEKNSLKDAGRIDVGNWVQSLRASGLQTPTIVNKCSYLRGFFDWAKARGYYPAFAKDDNPAAGQVVFRTREKRLRRAFGFKAFTDDQVKTLFSAEALAGLNETAIRACHRAMPYQQVWAELSWPQLKSGCLWHPRCTDW